MSVWVNRYGDWTVWKWLALLTAIVVGAYFVGGAVVLGKHAAPVAKVAPKA